MTSPGNPLRPKMLRGGLVQLIPSPPKVVNVIAFQYNPDTLTRTLAPRALGGEPGDRLETLRLTGPPKETIKVDVEFDASDDDLGSVAAPYADPRYVAAPYDDGMDQSLGLLPTLSALEALITPTTDQLAAIDALFDSGSIEIAPVEAPLTLFVWGSKRIVPVLISGLTVTEEAFGPQLQPIRAKVSLELKTLTSTDFAPGSPGERRYLTYRKYGEKWAALAASTNTALLGIDHVS